MPGGLTEINSLQQDGDAIQSYITESPLQVAFQ